MEACLQLDMVSCFEAVAYYGFWGVVTTFCLCASSFLSVWILVNTFVFFKELLGWYS